MNDVIDVGFLFFFYEHENKKSCFFSNLRILRVRKSQKYRIDLIIDGFIAFFYSSHSISYGDAQQ